LLAATAAAPDGGGGEAEGVDVEQTGERELTPSYAPPGAGRAARISTVGELLSIPAAWLDRLLALSHTGSQEGDRDEDLLQSLASSIERIVPDVRVAIRVPLDGTPAPGPTEPKNAVRSEPPRSNERVRSARVFPDLPYERSVALLGPSARGTLHFGSDKDILDSEGSPHVQLMDRASVVVARALARARLEARAAALELELRETRSQMVQAEKLASLGQIAAGMVHELNNPLTSIAAYTDFLLRRAIAREGADADEVERIRRIAESANRMLRLTRNLVSYARPSGDIPIAVQMNVVIDRALAFCEHEVTDVGVTVERSFDHDIGIVRGLPEQLAQVFVNLVTNACHAMAPSRDDDPTAGRVDRPPVLTISTARGTAEDGQGESHVSIVVQDAGCGIRKDHLALVFNPFFTTKGSSRGTGLGLSIVKSIVEAHRGRIRVESDPSYGTRFILVFPVEPGTVESASGVRPSQL
jgi:signal transduction histidine kinase